MVAKITIPKSIEAALNYNENKVQRGVAQCLFAANYLGEAKAMNFYQKLQGFERLNLLNDRATTKTLHVSLNFDPSEKLPDDKLIAIAEMYMQKLGFGEQPFLVYKHEDAGHPHIHIVSNTIREDGSRINTHNIGKNQSEAARKEIEQFFGLIKAEHHPRLIEQNIGAIDVVKAVYGKAETKRSISNAVNEVFSYYKFTSLPEFNAALKQFNVIADRGKEDGRIFKNRGLVYRLLDASGNKAGVPIKASSLSSKPTLNNLEQKFKANESAKDPLKQSTRTTIDECLLKASGDRQQLVNLLQAKQIHLLLRQNNDGRLYGVTFIDNENKVVFNGSDLGKSYSATGLLKSLLEKQAHTGAGYNTDNQLSASKTEINLQPQQKKENKLSSNKTESIMETLFSVKEQFENIPSQLLPKKRKKKRKKNDQ